MNMTGNASPIAIHGHTMCIGLPNTRLSLSAHELRSEMERAMEGSANAIVAIRLTGDVAITGPADGLFSHMPYLRDTAELGWLDTSGVTSMDAMFEGDVSLRGTHLVAGMSRWDMSHVTSMRRMFEGCSSLEHFPMRDKDLGALRDTTGMFRGCQSLKSVDMTSNQTPNLESTAEMFAGCTNLDEVYLFGLDTSHVTDMRAMFERCENLRDLSLAMFDASSAKDMTEMFAGCTNLIRVYARESRLPDAEHTATKGMFRGCDMLSDTREAKGLSPFMDKCGLTQDVLDARREKAAMLVRREGDTLVLGVATQPMLADAQNLRHEISRLCDQYDQDKRPKRIEFVGDIRLVGDASYLFSPCASAIESIEGMGHLDTSRVTDMTGMFCRMSALRSIDVSGLDTRNVTSMHSMFFGCTSLEGIDVSSFDTHDVEDMRYMFEDCQSLRSLDLSSFDMSNVVSAACLCNQCASLESASVAGWRAPNLVDASGLFGGCEKLAELDTTDFSTTCVADTNSMFANCRSLTELDLHGLSGRTRCASYMFSGCRSLRSLDIHNLEVDSSTPSHHTLTGCDAEDMHLTTSMVREMGYQEIERHDTLIIDADQLRPAKGDWAISLSLSDGHGVRQRTLLAPDEWIRDNGDGTLDVELPTIVCISGVEGGHEVTELTNAREIQYQSDVAREAQSDKARTPARTLAADGIDMRDEYHDEIPF